MRRLLAALAATGAVLGLSAATAAGQTAPALTITAPADRSSAPFSARAEIRGTLAGNPEGDAGQPVTLEAAAYPYTTFKPAGQAMTGADGSFSLPVRVVVNARYRVRGPHDATSAPITIFAKPFHEGR